MDLNPGQENVSLFVDSFMKKNLALEILLIPVIAMMFLAQVIAKMFGIDLVNITLASFNI